jgi:hypothetical protein
MAGEMAQLMRGRRGPLAHRSQQAEGGIGDGNGLYSAKIMALNVGFGTLGRGRWHGDPRPVPRIDLAPGVPPS